MEDGVLKAILYAFLAAVFYAINIPASKMLLRDVGPTTMAALLYLGAGIGIAGLSLFTAKDRRAFAPLSRRDLPYVIGMIVLDIAAPIFLMLGIRHGSSANASLLGNFEIVASTLIALFVGAFLSFLLLKESLSWIYLAALAVMVAGAALVVIDTLVRYHTHPHPHTYTHFHGGCIHTHTITHTHDHDHFMTDATHTHRHPVSELERFLVQCGTSCSAKTRIRRM